MQSLTCKGSTEILKNTPRKNATEVGVSNWLYQQALDSKKKKQEAIEKTEREAKEMMKPQITNLAQRTKPAYMDYRTKATILESVPEAPVKGAKFTQKAIAAARRSTPNPPKISNEESELQKQLRARMQSKLLGSTRSQVLNKETVKSH